MAGVPVTLTDDAGRVRFEGRQVGGGGSLPVLVARKVIENAAILTLPSLAVEIVPTPGTGKMLWPLAALLVCDTSSGVYGGIGGSLGVDYDGTFAAYPLVTVLDNNANGGVDNLLNPTGGTPPDTGALAVANLGPQEAVPPISLVPSGSAFTVATSSGQDPAGYADFPLVLAASNAGDYVDGNPANTLTVTLLYAEVTL